jgi:hypothetical protein
MTFRPTLLERAYQLADGGLCFTLSDIKSALHAEGFTAMEINTNLQGTSIAGSLSKRCKNAQAVASET